MDYRVVYGESMPIWEKTFHTRKEAKNFAKTRKACGDIVFKIAKVVPGEAPQSIMALINLVGD